MPEFIHVDKLHFEELKTIELGGFRRYVLPDGSKMPSITSILGETGDKAWLENWRTALGPAKANQESKRCADRGSTIHALTEKYLLNQELNLDAVQFENANLFRQLKFALNRINNIYGLEKAVYNRQLGVAGRCDCIAEFDEVLSVIDFKTANKNKRREMIDDYFMQATFYALAINEMFDECIEDIVILIAVEKGAVPLVFKDKINNHIKPLLTRVKEFRKKHER
jgi:genome maintenance exonuclease 1